MTQIDLGTNHPGNRAQLSPRAVEFGLAVTLAVLQATWTGVLAYGVWRLIFG
ncbi:hypothetical protein [Bosea massiliensis]|uniref:Uncharacterized protein n=1 Tax=Bosea massiliensis TaxID=151419 RepID=A0ABW0PAV2_9HYPH